MWFVKRRVLRYGSCQVKTFVSVDPDGYAGDGRHYKSVGDNDFALQIKRGTKEISGYDSEERDDAD